MFPKITRSRGHQYVQIVNSFREGNSVRHKVLFSLGRLDKLKDSESFKIFVSKLNKIAAINETDLKAALIENCSSSKILNWGYLVYKNLWQQCRITHIFNKIQPKYKAKYSFNDAVFLMVINHVLAPKSKLSIFLQQQDYANIPAVKLNNLYRVLDVLAEEKTTIEKQIFKQYSKNKETIDLVFYDVTTFHFESVRADSLKDFGFSKNCKFNEVQVVLGLLIDQDGLPIGYELFSGNTFEGKTLEQSLQKINKAFKLRNIIIVADRGINNKLNLSKIKAAGYGYIVATRIKSMSSDLRQQILEQTDYQYLNKKEEGFCFKKIEHINECKVENKKERLTEKIIATYSPKRALKDQEDRKRLIEKAKELLQDQSKLATFQKRGGRKYLSKELKGDESWFLNSEKIEEDSLYDGYYAIQTSELNMEVDDILNAYHFLWKIEESFRIMKSTLEVRPIFHWTESRIKGHFVVTFLSFLLERNLENQLKQNSIKATPNTIRAAIKAMRFSEITIGDTKYYITSELSELGKKILKLLNIKPYKNCFPVEQFKG